MVMFRLRRSYYLLIMAAMVFNDVGMGGANLQQRSSLRIEPSRDGQTLKLLSDGGLNSAIPIVGPAMMSGKSIKIHRDSAEDGSSIIKVELEAAKDGTATVDAVPPARVTPPTISTITSLGEPTIPNDKSGWCGPEAVDGPGDFGGGDSSSRPGDSGAGPQKEVSGATDAVPESGTGRVRITTSPKSSATESMGETGGLGSGSNGPNGGATHSHPQSGSPGDMQGSVTKPGDMQGSGTKPGDMQGSGTKPGDTQGGGTKPGDTQGSGTEPGDMQGSGTEPGVPRATRLTTTEGNGLDEPWGPDGGVHSGKGGRKTTKGGRDKGRQPHSTTPLDEPVTEETETSRKPTKGGHGRHTHGSSTTEEHPHHHFHSTLPSDDADGGGLGEAHSTHPPRKHHGGRGRTTPTGDGGEPSPPITVPADPFGEASSTNGATVHQHVVRLILDQPSFPQPFMKPGSPFMPTRLSPYGQPIPQFQGMNPKHQMLGPAAGQPLSASRQGNSGHGVLPMPSGLPSRQHWQLPANSGHAGRIKPGNKMKQKQPTFGSAAHLHFPPHPSNKGPPSSCSRPAGPMGTPLQALMSKIAPGRLFE